MRNKNDDTFLFDSPFTPSNGRPAYEEAGIFAYLYLLFKTVL